MEGGLLSLKWNDHSHTFFDMLSTIRKRESYCDVTLVCEGRFYPVHKLVLSTCSEFFDKLFSKTDCKHPVVIVANVAYKDLEALLNYMYLGEMNVLQTELGNLMKAAEVLRIKGLAEPTDNPSKESKDIRQPSPSESSDSNLKRKRLDEASGPSPKRSPQVIQRSSVVERTDPSVASSKDNDPVNLQLTQPSILSESTVPKDQSASTRGVSSSQLDPASSSQVPPRDQDSGEKSPRPEVKTEEICIKDDPGIWFEENEGSKDNDPFSEQDTSFNYDQQTVDFPSSGVSWPLSSGSQPPAMEGHFPQGLPGASGLQGDSFALGKKKWRKLSDRERAILVDLAKADPKASSEKLRSRLLQYHINISSRTIRRELSSAGLKVAKPHILHGQYEEQMSGLI